MEHATLPPLPSPSTFAVELIQARTLVGLTQSQLASKSGISLSAIKGYESGRNLPGARELREICQALEISPNKLLFGTEVPFKERSWANLLLDAEAEDDQVLRVRTSVLLSLLASDERAALLTLAKSLTIARHGEAKVREAITAADVLTGISREFGNLSNEAMSKGNDIDITESPKRLDEFLKRQGYAPTIKKLP